MQPIEDDCLQQAAQILSRGFPERSAAFWDAAVRRLSAYRKTYGLAPIGQMMFVDEKPVGIILTIAKPVGEPAAQRRVVNLSSWYVDAKYRWLAPRMLQRVVAEDHTTFTDFSPSPETEKINERLGFEVISENVLLFVLPLNAVARAEGHVVPFERLPADALSADDRRCLAHHRELGCIAAALRIKDSYSPLLFYVTCRKRIRVARLLLADNRHLAANIGAIARFLVRRRVLVLTMHADRSERIPMSIVWKQSEPVQIKGTWRRDRTDHTFSELVFLQL